MGGAHWEHLRLARGIYKRRLTTVLFIFSSISIAWNQNCPGVHVDVNFKSIIMKREREPNFYSVVQEYSSLFAFIHTGSGKVFLLYRIFVSFVIRELLLISS